MIMSYSLLTLLGILFIIILVVILMLQKNNISELQGKLIVIQSSLNNLELNIKEDFRITRLENKDAAKEDRIELSNSLNDFSHDQKMKLNELKQEQKAFLLDVVIQLEKLSSNIERNLHQLNEQAKQDNHLIRGELYKHFQNFQESFTQNVQSFNNFQKERFSDMETVQNKLVDNTGKKLDEMRMIVDEKLQKTLNERLGQSFELVGKQLESVQKGLGEMQVLAQDVGGLKRVLSNVKMRGGIGEVQLAMLLEQILAPEQYGANVKTKLGSSDIVEFALKLPGRNDGNSVVWLPIDAKFPRDIYEHLQTAYENGNLNEIADAQKSLENTIKRMAKDIHEKYIDPPNTTDFGILFLPFEGIYAEVVRKSSLLETLQRDYKIIVTGPTTLAAILNSLQMGFKTLAIQKRSGEVWQVLAEVKKEFGLFGGILEKAQKSIQTGLGQLDDVMGKRTRSIQRKLKEIETEKEHLPIDNQN